LIRRHCALQKDLRAHFHLAVLNVRKDAHGAIAITLQTAQKLSLRLQTKQRSAIVYGINDCLCALIIAPNLKDNDSLSACRQKDFAGKDLKKKLLAFKTDFSTGV
jgi:hypothetical protein